MESSPSSHDELEQVGPLVVGQHADINVGSHSREEGFEVGIQRRIDVPDFLGGARFVDPGVHQTTLVRTFRFIRVRHQS